MLDARHVTVRSACFLGLLFAVTLAARAERLPIRQYSAVDGLPTDAVGSVYRDSRGYLWFGTHGGLSRFDGHGFVNYGVEHGLPVDVMVDFVEDREGKYWVATWGGGGISRFDPDSDDSKRLFTPHRLGDGSSDRSTALLVDQSGRIWVGTVSGLFVRDGSDDPDPPFRRVGLDAVPGDTSRVRIVALTEDRRGNLWVVTPGALVRLSPTGRSHLYPIGNAEEDAPRLSAVLEDREGRIWVAHSGGVTVFRPSDEPPSGEERIQSCAPGSKDGSPRLPVLPGESCWFSVAEFPGRGEPRGLFEASGGRVWITRYSEGLTEFDGSTLHTHGEADGVGGYLVVDLDEDDAGNLWLATLDSGALRIARTGFLSYDRADGVGYTRRARLAESLRGEISIISGPVVYRFDGTRFESLKPRILEGLGDASADMSVVLQDHAGEWWFGTRRGLFRFDAADGVGQLVGREPIASFTEATGLPGNGISALFEDSVGDIWIGVNAPDPIVRWERSTGTLHHYPGAQGPNPSNRPLDFAEDDEGGIWVGFTRGATRIRDGRFDYFSREQGLTADVAVRPYVDREGRLWLTSGYSGVTRIDEPGVEDPSFDHRYTVAEGLVSNPVLCAVDDLFGRMYFCTTKGVDRLDPETGRVRHYTRADGLSTSEIVYGMRARDGSLWFTSMRGVSRLLPRAEPPSPPPPVWITGVQVSGTPVPLSELGETEVSDLRLPAAGNQVRIDFASLSFEVGNEIRYRHRLGRAASAWSDPTYLQSIHFANLSPGRYRFEVRAVNSHGVESGQPATVSFTILPPFWRRWWFLTLAVLALAGLAVGVHRLRVARVVELERVRTRIATDLHDDIGASLSQIAILSEVVNRRSDLESSTSRTYLSRIADSSRELVDSMADIVWAINPKRDRLSDVVQRMRRFVGDAVAGGEIEYTFHGPPPERDLRLGPDMRRQLFLVFKESVNNAVRHSGCDRLEVRLALDGSRLLLEITDDGDGFEVDREYDGNGLDSMQRRARELHGKLRLHSQPGRGTTVRLEVPLDRRRRAGTGSPSPE